MNPDLPEVRVAYATNLRMTILLVAAPVSFLFVFAHPLLGTWIGSSFADQAAWPLRFVAIAAFGLALSPAPADLARGFGRPGLVTVYTAASAVVTFGTAFLTVPSHHAAGAAFAIAVGAVVTTIPFAFISPGLLLGQGVRSLFRALCGPLASLLLAVVLYALGAAVADTFGSALITGGVGTIIYIAVCARFVLDRRERELVRMLRDGAAPAHLDRPHIRYMGR